MKRPHRQRGQSLVETALVLPVLVFLFMALLQLLAWGWASVLCTHAAHAAARVYSVRHGADEAAALRLAQDTAERILSRALPPAWPQVLVEEAPEGECRLHLSAVLPPLWSWRWALLNHGLMDLQRSAQVQDENTPARQQEDAFKQPS